MNQHDGAGEADDALTTRLLHEVHRTLRAADVYADVLRDRFELAGATDVQLLDGIPAGLLVHLAAVSNAFIEGALHTLWYIEPALARNAQVVAGLARDGAGAPSDEA